MGLKEEKRRGHAATVLPIPFEELLGKLYDALQIARRTESVGSKSTTANSSTNSNHGREKRSGGFNPKATGHALGLNMLSHSPSSNSNTQYSEKAICVFCAQNHSPFHCSEAKAMSTRERCDVVQQKGLCFNCLKSGHLARKCTSGSCKHCSKRHHTLLHYSKPTEAATSNSVNCVKSERKPAESAEIRASASLVKATSDSLNRSVLLQSAIVKVESSSTVSKARVLFDSGSGVSLAGKNNESDRSQSQLCVFACRGAVNCFSLLQSEIYCV